MQCEICHLRPAARALTRKVDGEPRELYVCDECARTAAAPVAASASEGASRDVSDLLFSIGFPVPASKKARDRRCPGCGLSRGELRENRRFGCPRCYEAFEADARTFLSEQIPAAPRSREAPAEAMQEREVARLKASLSKAVKEDRYEEASEIAARLRALRGPDGGPAAEPGSAPDA